MASTLEQTGSAKQREWLLRIARIPVPLLLAAIIAARAAGLRETYESPTAMLILSFIFYTLLSLGTLFLIGRSFLATGSPGLLLLECGVILWSLAGTLGDALSHGDANSDVTIFNTGILVAGIFHLAGAVLVRWPQRSLQAKRFWLAAGCVFTLALLWLIARAALAGWLPVFFIQGQGGMPVRYWVLISAIAMFVLSAGILYAGRHSQPPPFTFWYARAMSLLALGLFGIMIQVSLFCLVNWMSRAAQWLGGVYLLFAALAALREADLPLLPSPERARRAYYRDAMAIVIVLGAAAVRMTFLSVMGSHAPFVLFYPAVIFAAIYGGLRAGLLATAAAGFIAAYLWFPRLLGSATTAEWLGMIIFLMSGAMLSWITEALHRARARAVAAESEALLAVERQKAAERLRESEKKLVLALDAAEQAPWEIDLITGAVTASQRLYEIYGAGESFPLAKQEPWREFVLEDDKPRLQEAIDTAIREKGRYRVEYRVRRRMDGAMRWVLGEGRLDKDEQGRPVRLIGVARDITESKRLEDELRRKEEEARHLIRYAPSAVYEIDFRGPKFLNVNDFMCQQTGYSREELLSMDPFELLDKGSGVRFRNRIEQVRAGESPAAFVEYTIRTKDGRTRSVVLNMSLIYEEGKPVRALVVGHDVTERKRMEDELRRSHAELEVRVQERTKELTQTVSILHERSEQLRRMTAELTLAEQRERQRLSQVLHDGLQQILVGAKYRLASVPRSPNVHQATDQVTELIDDAIEVSRSLTAELSPPILMQGDLFLTLEWLARWMHDKHELDVNLIAGKKIEPLPEEVILLLFQAARELLFNVVKHAGVRTARVEVNQLDGRIQMTIEDEGAGFDPNQLSIEGGYFGGKGLFSIRERLFYLGGQMEIDAAPGRGSRFKLIVPDTSFRTEADRSSAGKQVQVSVAVSSNPVGKPADTARRLRIVLVDDHLVMRQGLAGLLRMEPDFEIAGEASDGESAVGLIRELKPDVVLMDIGMPGMDGIQATRIINKELPEVRIIGLSMFQEGEQQASMRDAGAVDYVTKSGPSADLIKAIRACVSKKNDEQSAGRAFQP